MVIGGSSGECAALTVAEKGQLVKKAREIAIAQGKPNFPITLASLLDALEISSHKSKWATGTALISPWYWCPLCSIGL